MRNAATRTATSTWTIGRDEREAHLAPHKARRIPTLAMDMAEACRALGVADNTLRDMIDCGIVPALRVGRRVLIPLDAARQRLTELALREARKRAGHSHDSLDADDALAPATGAGKGVA